MDDFTLGLLKNGKNFGAVATIMSDGSPQTSVIWVDTDDTHVIFNTAEGRVKTRNIRRDGRVGVTVWNAENPYQQTQIRGTVVAITGEGADAHIDSLAKKYLGADKYPFRQPGEKRLIIKVRPDKIHLMK